MAFGPAWRDLVDAALDLTVIGSFTNLGFRARRALWAWEDLGTLRLDGRTVLVTGATSGLGLAAAHRLAAMGAATRIVGRDPQRTRRAADDVRRRSGNPDVAEYVADLADLAQVRDLVTAVATREERLDVLVHNAGALLPSRTLTPQGHEATFATMVLAPALLTESLLFLLTRSATTSPAVPPVARVLLVSSGGMYTQRLDVADPARSYRGSVVYARAKRAQVVLASEWGERWHDRSVVVHALHPGWAATPGVQAALPTFERVLRPLLRTPDEGADTLVWLTAADEPARCTGRFWHDRRPRPVHYLPHTRETPADRARLTSTIAAAIDPFRPSRPLGLADGPA